MRRIVSIIAVITCLFCSAGLQPSVWADSVEVTKPVVTTDEAGNTMVRFHIDAQGVASRGYDITAALYSQGRMVDAATRRLNQEIGEVTLDFGKTEAFDSCKLFALDVDGCQPLMKSVKLVDGEAVTPLAEQYGLIVELVDANSDPSAAAPALKLFLQDGTMRTFPAIEFNRYASEAVLFQEANGKRVWDTSKIKPEDIIRFGTNSKGELIIIEGVAGLNTNLVLRDGKTSNVSKKGYWDAEELSKNIAIFAKEEQTEEGEKTYMSFSYREVLDTDTLTAVSYIYDTEKKMITAMKVKPDFSLSGVRYGVIEDVSAEGDAAKISGYMNGNYVTFTTDRAWADSQQAWKRTELFQMTFGYEQRGHAESLIPFSELKDDSLSRRATGALTGPVTLSGLELTYGEDASVMLASDCRVYLQSSGFWEVGSFDNLAALNSGLEAEFYDVFNRDGSYDIAIIRQASAAEDYAVVTRLTDQTSPTGGGPKVKLLSGQEREIEFEIAPLGENDEMQALFHKSENGSLLWNRELIGAGSVIRYRTDSAARINRLEGAAGLGSDLESARYPQGVTCPIEQDRYWNGLEFTKDTVIYANYGDVNDLGDGSYYYVTGSYDLEYLYDLTAYSYLAKDNKVIAITVKDNFGVQDKFGLITGLEEKSGGQVLLKGYINSSYKEFYAAREVVPGMLLNGDFSQMYHILSSGEGVVQEMLLFKDVMNGSRYMRMMTTGPLFGEYGLNSRTFLYNDEHYTLDRDCDVYVMKNGVWTKESAEAFSQLKDGDSVELYDYLDEDGIYDTALLKQK